MTDGGLLDDPMALENSVPDHQKPLWLLGVNDQEICLIVEALTPIGAKAVAQTLDLLLGSEDLTLLGPHQRGSWPPDLWYRWLTTGDVAAFLAGLEKQEES